MKILDMSGENRAIWYDKQQLNTIYIDIRQSVRPDIICSSCCLPFKKEQFDLIVFDPPHVNFGANAQMTKTYGHMTTQQIRELIVISSYESWRVTKLNSLMALKWNDHDQKIEKIFKLLSPFWIPLFGHKVSQRLKHVSQTYWCMLLRNNIPQLQQYL